MSRPALGAPWPTSSTRLLALLGWPVGHSLSPTMHNAALRELGLDHAYVALPTPPERLACVVEALGAVGAVGANVTVPHKQAVVGLCDELSEEAELVGAVNTLVWRDGDLLGDNTDAAGLVTALEEEVRPRPGETCVVLGTGGAARAVAVAAGRLGLRLVAVGRRPDAAAEIAGLAERAGAPDVEHVDLAATDAVTDVTAAGRLIVNATSLGLGGEPLPEPFLVLGPGQVAYDLVYRPPRTPFLRAARERGAEAHNGLGMLVAQAAASLQRWTGRPAPVGTMSAAALGALSMQADST